MEFTKEQLEKIKKFASDEQDKIDPVDKGEKNDGEIIAKAIEKNDKNNDEIITKTVKAILAELGSAQEKEEKKEEKVIAKSQKPFVEAPAVMLNHVDEPDPAYIGAYVAVKALEKSRGYTFRKAADAWADMAKSNAAGFIQEKAVNESVLSEGGVFAIPEIDNQIIKLLTAENKFRQIPELRVRRTKSSQLQLKRMRSGCTAYWEGENTTDNLTASSPTFDKIYSTPKKVMAYYTVTKDFLQDNGQMAEAEIQSDLIYRAANLENLAFYNGLGAEYQPKGLYHWISSDNKTATAGTSAANSETDIFEILENIQGNNVDGNITFLMPVRTSNAYKKFRDSVSNGLVWPGMRETTMDILGYPVIIDNNIPITLGGSTNTQIWGVAGRHVSIIDRMDSTIEIDPPNNDSNIEQKIGEHLILLTKRVDLVVHNEYAASVIEDVTI